MHNDAANAYNRYSLCSETAQMVDTDPAEKPPMKCSIAGCPGTYEPMCNPLSQAELLNDAGCELNIVLGLCVGHDSLFFKYSKGLATTLVAKDRVLAHNPVGALQLADTYFQRVWGPLRPTEAPKLPAGGRD